MEGYWRTAQAAAELEISAHHMRKLCEANLLEAERTEGGQWRIPAMQEVERLKKQGVPPIPVIAEDLKPKQRRTSPKRQRRPARGPQHRGCRLSRRSSDR